MLTYENREKLNCSKIDKSWIDYRALTKIRLLANIDRPCNGDSVTTDRVLNDLQRFPAIQSLEFHEVIQISR